MQISSTELKNNLGKYLAMASRQDIYVTRNGKPLVKLSPAVADRVSLLDDLVGIIPKDSASAKDIKGERLKRQ